MEDLRRWHTLVLWSLHALRKITRTEPHRNSSGHIDEGLTCEAVREGVRSATRLLRTYVTMLEREMNTLSMMQPHAQPCGDNMPNEKNTLLEEFHLELNPPDAHIHVRCSTKAQALEYAKRLFPKSYNRDDQSDINKTYIHFNETEQDNGNANGIVQRVTVPNKWVMNRRLQDAEKKAA